MVVVRAHHYAPADDDWRGRVLAAAERAARAERPRLARRGRRRADRRARPRRRAAARPPSDGEVAPRRRGGRARAARRACTASPSRSATRAWRTDPVDLYRAGNEALLAANVAEARPARGRRPVAVLAFEDTGAYRLLLPAMSEDPAELQRFYEETVAPLVAYDEQYETDLVQTLETFLDADGNVAGTAAAAVHPPPHGPLPARARARPHRARRLLDRRPREARPRAEGDARARHRRAARSGHGGRRRRRARPPRDTKRPLEDLGAPRLARRPGTPSAGRGERARGAARARARRAASAASVVPPR